MAFRKFFFVLITLFALGCNAEKKEKAKGISSGEIKLLRTGIDIEPAILKVDSIEVIYYDDPGGDSLRYSRYFSFTTHSDSSFIRPVLRSFLQDFTQYGQPLKCRSEGKMIMHSGEVPIRTVYFSTGADSCSYLYFIKNGNFFYFKLPEGIKDLFSSDKKNAGRPD